MTNYGTHWGRYACTGPDCPVCAIMREMVAKRIAAEARERTPSNKVPRAAVMLSAHEAEALLSDHHPEQAAVWDRVRARLGLEP